MFLRKILVVCVLLALLTMSALPVRAQTMFGSPQLMLFTYYDRLNVRDYQAAYGQWFTPLQSFPNFINGFADTSRITPYFGDFQPSNTALESGRIPGVLLGYHTDGSK